MAGERRGGDRERVVLQARVENDGKVADCAVRNLSPGGAKLSMTHPPASGTEVTLDLPPFGKFKGVIAWSGKKEVGLRFREDPDAVAEVLMSMAMYGFQ